MCIGGDIAAKFAECVLLVYVAVCSKPDKGLEQTRDFAFSYSPFAKESDCQDRNVVFWKAHVGLA